MPASNRTARTVARAGRTRRASLPRLSRPNPSAACSRRWFGRSPPRGAHNGLRGDRSAGVRARARAGALRIYLYRRAAANARLRRNGELFEAKCQGADRAFVTSRAVRAEARVRERMREGRDRGWAFSQVARVEAAPGPTRRTDGDRAAIRLVALSRDRLAGVQGHAGADKTTLRLEAARLPGLPALKGVAPPASAVRGLVGEAGIASRTLQWLLARISDLSDPAHLA